MVSAQFEYRDYVGPYTIAIKFASLRFNGHIDNKLMLSNLVDLIEYEKYYKQKALIECWAEKKEQNNKRIQELNSQLEQLKKKYKLGVLFVAGDKVKAIKKEIESLKGKNLTINARISALDEDNFFDVYEKKTKFRELLSYLNFSCKTSYHKSENDISVEIYESTLSDEQLYEKAKAKYDELKAKRDKEIESLKTNFEHEEAQLVK